MANMIFVNPSANIYNLSKELIRKGNEVLFVNNKEIPTIAPEHVIYFYDKTHALFNDETQEITERDERALLFKSKFFNKLKMIGVSHNLTTINRCLAPGDFNDLVMFKSRAIITPSRELPAIRSYDNLSEIITTYPRHSIFASTLKDEGSLTLVSYNSDYDFRSAFGNDYYVLFLQGSKLEMYVCKNNLVIISKVRKPIDMLMRAFPTLSKFHFDIDKSFTILKNHTPYVNYDFPTKAIVLNDYSFGKSSIKMSQNFYEKLADYVISPK